MAHSIIVLGTQLNIFSMSTKHIYNFFRYPSCILRIMNIATDLFLGKNPNCILFKMTSVRICLSSTLSTIFMTCSSSFISQYNRQLFITVFPLKISKITLVFHSSIFLRADSHPSSLLPQFRHMQPLYLFQTYLQWSSWFSDFIFCIVSTISLRATLSPASRFFYYISFHHLISLALFIHKLFHVFLPIFSLVFYNKT